jgi:hypothetical protein
MLCIEDWVAPWVDAFMAFKGLIPYKTGCKGVAATLYSILCFA